jgi:class 3 adenylate cyclase
VPLRRSEFALLLAFARERGRVLTRDHLLDAVAGRVSGPFDRSIDVLVSRLRKKIEVDPKTPRLILTVPRVGYRFATRPRAAPEPSEANTDRLGGRLRSWPHSAERRQITVMVCGLTGSPAPTQPDPQDLHRVMAAFHRCCVTAIARFGGATAGYIGDGVLAFFGYPEAREHDAERAIRAGLAVIEAVARTAPDPAAFHARVGIATGLMVAGDLLGDGAAPEHAVLGEARETVKRLLLLARADAFIVSAATQRLGGWPVRLSND